MKLLTHVIPAFLMVILSGCVVFGERTSPGNPPAARVDLSGTYKGQDGTLVIEKVNDAHLMQSPPTISGYSQTVAIPAAQVEKAKKKHYTDTGTIAPNAYLVNSKFTICPLKINNIALLDGDELHSADIDGPTYNIWRQENGSLDLGFPMSMIRRKGGHNCSVMAPFLKVTE